MPELPLECILRAKELMIIKMIGRPSITAALLAAGVAVAGAGVALAFTSQDFALRAQSWVNANCTQKLLNSFNSTPNNQKATECFNYYKNQEQESEINALLQVSSPILADGNGKTLGTPVDGAGRRRRRERVYDLVSGC